MTADGSSDSGDASYGGYRTLAFCEIELDSTAAMERLGASSYCDIGLTLHQVTGLEELWVHSLMQGQIHRLAPCSSRQETFGGASPVAGSRGFSHLTA